MVQNPVVRAVELVAAREVRHRLVELAHRQIAMTAPPVEHRFIRRDGESARERCDGLAELTGSRLRDAERDQPLYVARIGVECRFGARDWAGVGLRAVCDAGRTAILYRLRAGRGDCDRETGQRANHAYDLHQRSPIVCDRVVPSDVRSALRVAGRVAIAVKYDRA